MNDFEILEQAAKHVAKQLKGKIAGHAFAEFARVLRKLKYQQMMDSETRLKPVDDEEVPF